ncbi:MAG: energy-coupling factor transporter transmembrane component T family protein [Pyramidobacter sp.]|jgi:cobalt/nickel transport system permease protein
MKSLMSLDASRLFTERTQNILDLFDPRGRMVCATVYAVAISALDGAVALAVAALFPAALLFCGPVRPLFLSLRRLNVVSLAMTALLMVTWPGEPLWGPFTREGLRQGVLITVRLNLISLPLLRLMVAMGPARSQAALERLGCPEKLRILFLLTLRGIYLLARRMGLALQAINLRSGAVSGRSSHLKGMLRWKVFAFMAASSLLQSADRSERMMLALKCRGGLAGFAAGQDMRWKIRDTALAAFCAAVLAIALAFNFSGGPS